jgi:hypothetical protein
MKLDKNSLERYAYQAWSILLNSVKGYRTNKKIVIIESDDWGAIRTTKEGYRFFKNKKYNVDKSVYMLDCLESNSDLDALYNVLDSHIDSNGNPAVFTANVILTNPDFQKIYDSNYKKYTYKRIDHEDKGENDTFQVSKMWMKGYSDKLFIPQLHGREHIQWWKWMDDLQQGSEEALSSFKYKMCGVPKNVSKLSVSYYEPVFVHDKFTSTEDNPLEESIKESAAIFTEITGYSSISAIAPVCTWNDDVERHWNDEGIKLIQGAMIQYSSTYNKNKYIPRYTGESNSLGQLYSTRNCFFEPSKGDTVNKVMKQISMAFFLKKPAIISSHRVNYVGGIKIGNRDNGLKQLNKLLSEIRRKWPDVVFMSTKDFYKQLLD